MNFASNQQQKHLKHPLRNKVTAWCLQKSKSVKPIHTYAHIHKEWICGCAKNANVNSFERKSNGTIYRSEKEQQARFSVDPSLFLHTSASHQCEINNTRTSHSVSAWFVRAIAVLAYLAGNLFSDDWHAPIRQARKVRLEWWMSSGSKYQH